MGARKPASTTGRFRIEKSRPALERVSNRKLGSGTGGTERTEMKRAELKGILRRILTKPTAPFREECVAAEIIRFCREEGLEARPDPHGNLIAIYRPKKGLRKGRIGFVAHMDHPGFEIIASEGRTARAAWTGGVLRKFFRNAAVNVHHDGGVKGRVVRTTPRPNLPKFVSEMDLRMDRPVPVGAFGQWDLTPFEMQGNLIVTRAADDLCSVAAELALLRELKRAGVRHEIWLIFTRAEENGFTGALAMLGSGVLPKDLPLISLETSKFLPGAKQGGGPVIRLGDRALTYSPDLLRYMETAAGNAKKRVKTFRFQRRVMDGGTCEATAFLAKGHTAAGIAFPLGNYHNMGDLPDENGRPVLRAETVDIRDVQNGVELMLDMANGLSELPRALDAIAKSLDRRNKPDFKRLKEKRP